MTPVLAMTDAAYVFGGWALTAGVFAVYAARLRQKSKRASQGLKR